MKRILVRAVVFREIPLREFLAKFLAYGAVYGLLIINTVDLMIYFFRGYHLFLTLLYVFPFLVMLLLRGLRDWKLILAMLLYVSLFNDLFFHAVGVAFGWRTYDLAEAYMFQLGLMGMRVGWTADFLLARIPVSSILMGSSIYARIVAVILLLKSWLKEVEKEAL